MVTRGVHTHLHQVLIAPCYCHIVIEMHNRFSSKDENLDLEKKKIYQPLKCGSTL